MNISFEIPHDIEQQIRTNGLDVNGKAREAFLVELYREHKITHRQLGDALGLERYDTDGVLKRYGVGLGMSVEEIKAEVGLLRMVSPAPRNRDSGITLPRG
jgi:Uncharacterised protein family (UPF0175)